MTKEEFIQQAMKNSSKKSNIESRYKKAERQFNHVKDMPYGSERVNCLMEITTDVECMIEDYNNLVPLVFPDSDSGEFYDFNGNKINTEDIEDYSTNESDYRFYLDLIGLNKNIKLEIEDDMTNTSKANRTKPPVPFADYLIAADINGLLAEIRLQANGKGGVRIAEIIIALQELNLMRPPAVQKRLYEAIRAFLGYNIGTNEAINLTLADYNSSTGINEKRKSAISQIKTQLLKFKSPAE